jgi:3-methylcrotonyl-CoA carboxylase alpha subunit
MEMNTRLQVEHPVTECITGEDLVEWQLRVASGEKLPKAQHELSISGHALEARLYAENPASGFLPSTGPLTHFELPEHVRIDTGVARGAAVTPFYDPMIAKLIVHAPTRPLAAAKLARACAEVEVWPVKTNAAFLSRAAAHPEFVAARIDTGFIEKHLAELVPTHEPSDEVFTAAARARLAAYRQADDVWGSALGFRLNAEPSVNVEVQSGAARKLVDLTERGTATLHFATVGHEMVVFEHGAAFAFTEPVSLAAVGGAASDGAIRAPMPGKIIAVSVAEGDAVVSGQALITVEAMKMEHTLAAPFDGRAEGVSHKVGDQVAEGTILLRITRGTP